MWKRKAEQYLVSQAVGAGALNYTIVHPGGLIDEKVCAGGGGGVVGIGGRRASSAEVG